MTYYEQTFTTTATRPHASTHMTDRDLKVTRDVARRVLTYVVAAVLMLVVVFSAVEMTMGYGLTDVGHSPQPDQGPVL